jgi:hypothetical protein
VTYRVVQWSTGNVGSHALRLIAHQPELELVGLWVHSSDKVGRDAGELIHAFSGPLAMKATVHDLLRAPWYHPTLSEIVTYPLEEIAEKTRGT